MYSSIQIYVTWPQISPTNMCNIVSINVLYYNYVLSFCLVTRL